MRYPARIGVCNAYIGDIARTFGYSSVMSESDAIEGSPPEYERCRTCGEYFPKDSAINGYYCSNFCARRYTRCRNCGSYFFRADPSDPPYCSPECMENFDEEYKHIRLSDDRGDFI